MPAIPAPFRIPDFRTFWLARLCATLSGTMLVIVIGWQVYDLARATMSQRDAAFMLGMVGLAQFAPLFGLTLFVGVIVDRVDRRLVAGAAVALNAVSAAILGGLALTGHMSLTALFVIAVLLGVGRAFSGPSFSALGPNLVPREILPAAIALNSISWQAGAIVGPPIGAYLYAAHPAVPYILAALLFAMCAVMILRIGKVALPPRQAMTPWRSVVEGLSYVRHNRVVLGAISLDLFAVLLGGATAMLPVYARDVLHVGVEGLGPLRGAPAVGAAAVALLMAFRPLASRVGPVMFGGVALFGLSTVIFGLSTSYPLSLAALVVLGAADMISVYVRSSLIQLHTPDAMRGRVSSVSMLFISASNELGEFESGLTAAWLGPVEAVVAGGIGAIVITGLWAWGFPELRRADRFVARDDAGPAVAL